ncbi:MAG: hypothetical protein U1F11_11975 [Steroidobacteraceae bacterium]
MQARLAAAGVEATRSAPAARSRSGHGLPLFSASLDAGLDGLLAQQAVLATFLDLWCAPEGDA